MLSASGEISRIVPVTAIVGPALERNVHRHAQLCPAISSLATAKTASRSSLREISTTIWPATTTWPGSAPVAVTMPSSGARSWV